MNDTEEKHLSFILSSKNRLKIILLLNNEVLSTKDISLKSDLAITSVSRTISELKNADIILPIKKDFNNLRNNLWKLNSEICTPNLLNEINKKAVLRNIKI